MSHERAGKDLWGCYEPQRAAVKVKQPAAGESMRQRRNMRVEEMRRVDVGVSAASSKR
jgi:enhancing lycopene biosynthesis protein 2